VRYLAAVWDLAGRDTGAIFAAERMGDELFGDECGQSLRDSVFVNSGGTSIEEGRGGGRGEFSGFNK
jgi:hypothetical protein